MSKIAFVTEGVLTVPPVNGGAVGELIYSLVKQNEKKGKHEFEIYSISSPSTCLFNYSFSKFIYIKIPGIIKALDRFVYFFARNVFKLNKQIKFRYIFQRLFYLKRLRKEFLKRKYDVTFLEGNTSLFLFYKKVFRKRKDLFVFHAHNDVGSLFVNKKILNKIIWVGNSRYVLDSFSNRFELEMEQRYILKNCCATHSACSDLNVREKHNIPCDKKIVLYVGRLTEQKGVLELIKAFNYLNNPDYYLLIVGSPLFGVNVSNEYEKSLKNESLKNKNIIFVGFIPNSILPNYYKHSDVGVFPSLYGEAAGLTIVESLKYGLKTITTNVGGIPEYTINTKTVVLDPLKTDFVYDLANAINSILCQGKEEINDSAFIESEFSESKYYDSFCNIISLLRAKQ